MGRRFAQQNAVNDGSTQASIAIVEDHELARRNRTLRLVELNIEPAAVTADGTGLIGLPITHFCHAFQACIEVVRCCSDPAGIRCDEAVAEQQVSLSLGDDQRVVLHALVDDVPGLVTGILAAADLQSLTLAEGVVHQSVMGADLVPVWSPDWPRIGRQIRTQEFAKRSLTDETDSSTVFFVVDTQAAVPRHAANFTFLQFAKREASERIWSFV